jgi:type I restriction enzyme S subunit
MPPLSEQKQILREIEVSIVDIISATARVQKEISFLAEYKSRLTADVVTGKIDVQKFILKSDRENSIHFLESQENDAEESGEIIEQGVSV